MTLRRLSLLILPIFYKCKGYPVQLPTTLQSACIHRPVASELRAVTQGSPLDQCLPHQSDGQ